MAFIWECPHCHKLATIDSNNEQLNNVFIDYKERIIHSFRLDIRTIICPNEECKKYSLTVEQFERVWQSNVNNINGGYHISGDFMRRWSLIPDTLARSFPEYIPHDLIEDYEEACKIEKLSPKASATLARRCLEGLLINFYKLEKGTLNDKIKQLPSTKMDPSLIKAIDGIREIGNIGAHFKKDINLIVEVEPDEARILIELIEILFEETYIADHNKNIKLSKMNQIVQNKKANIQQQKQNLTNQSTTNTNNSGGTSTT